MNPVTVTVGLTTNAVTAGLKVLKDKFQELRHFANSELAGILVGGGLVATLHAIVEQAVELVNVGNRFGILPSALQEIANAAKPNGAALEDVAMGMNKLVISQEKVRKGSKGLREELKVLGVDAEAFSGASPQDAFYMVADAVHGAANETAAYGAVIQLMGRGSGVLFSTLRQGSDDIKATGQAMGVMSDASAEKLHQLDDVFLKLKNGLLVYGGEAILFVSKVVQSAGAIAAGIVMTVSSLFSHLGSAISQAAHGEFAEAGKSLNAALDDLEGKGAHGETAATTAVRESMKEIWDKPKEKDRPRGSRLDMEETEAELRAREKLKTLYEKIDETKEKMRTKELEGEEKLNELMRVRDELNMKAAGEEDAIAQAELWQKALVVQEQINSEREKAAKDAEAREDRIAAKREALEGKLFQLSLDQMSEDEKRTALAERRAQLVDQVGKSSDEEERLTIRSHIADLDKQLEKKTPEKRLEVVSSSLTRIGGGGRAYLQKDDNDKVVSAVNQVKTEAAQARVYLQKIEKKIDRARWQP